MVSFCVCGWLFVSVLNSCRFPIRVPRHCPGPGSLWMGCKMPEKCYRLNGCSYLILALIIAANNYRPVFWAAGMVGRGLQRSGGTFLTTGRVHFSHSTLRIRSYVYTFMPYSLSLSTVAVPAIECNSDSTTQKSLATCSSFYSHRLKFLLFNYN